MNISKTPGLWLLHYRAVMAHAPSTRAWWWPALVASLVVNLLVLTPTLYMLQLYERVLYSMNPLTLGMVSLLALVLLVAMALADRWRGIWLTGAADDLQRRLSVPLFQAGWHAALQGQPASGTERQRDLAAIRQFIVGPGFSGLLDLPWTPVYAALAWLLHPLLGLAVLCFLLLQCLLAWQGHALSVPAAQGVQAAVSEEFTHVRRQFQQADTVAAMGMAPGLLGRWLERHRASLDATMQSLALSNRLAGVSKSLRYLQQSAALGLGAWLVARGELSAGAMIAGTVLATRALAPVDAVVGQWKDLLATLQALGRVDAALAPSVKAPPALVEHAALAGDPLTLDDVKAWVPGTDQVILRGVSLVLPPSQVIALTGPSGAGKSTLARVMARGWPHASGTVWRPQGDAAVGYLPQDVVLLPGTVGENIARMAQPDPQAVVTAAQGVGLHELILRLPKGYDTVVGEGGYPLSGGMCQRVGLARAIYGQAQLLVLDEPSAHLDEAGALALLALLNDLRQRGCTVIVVTHARAMLQAADRILSLDSGQIVADDTAVAPPQTS